MLLEWLGCQTMRHKFGFGRRIAWTESLLSLLLPLATLVEAVVAYAKHVVVAACLKVAVAMHLCTCDFRCIQPLTESLCSSCSLTVCMGGSWQSQVPQSRLEACMFLHMQEATVACFALTLSGKYSAGICRIQAP